MIKLHPRFALTALVLAAALPRLAAQTADTQPAADDQQPATSSRVVKLENFEVNGVPISKQILPSARPFNSVFGTDDSIIEVPRNVTIISRQQLSDISINSVQDISKLTSSAYTTTNFGAPSNPSIRGQSADLYVNGVRARITSNGNGLPLNFNAVESINIVKGPATAVQGTSMYVGGFVDMITKQPYFDTTKGYVSLTLGTYGKKAWTIDQGGPLSKQAAYRVSYSGEDSGGYWNDYYNKNQSFYGAVIYRPNDHYNIFMNASATWYRYTENWGMNRVTQDLIDNGLYQTGINNNNKPGAPSDAQNSVNVLGGGNSLALGPVVKINRHARLLNPANHSTGREFNAQVVQTDTISPDLKIVNNTYWSYTARNTLSTYYYSEIIDPSWFAENRTSVIFTTKNGSVVNAGLDLRYQSVKAYDDYFYEPANVWDLTKDLRFVNVYNSTDFGKNHGFPVPGWPGRYASPGVWNGDTNDSQAFTAGPFVQATWKVSDKVNLITGGRYDFFSAKVRDPLVPYPVPTYKINVGIPSYNGSLIFKATPTASYYLTYNYSENTSGAAGNGGGITGWNSAGTGLDKQNFTQPSELTEAGAKFALDSNKVFLNFALYNQKRTAKSTSSTTIQKFEAKGFEAELNYQPNKHLYATLSYSYIDATTTAPYQSDGGISPLKGEDTLEPWVFSGVRQVSGLPKHLFNGLVSYSWDSGWNVSANTIVTGEINNNYAGTLVIPVQYELDCSIGYHTKTWDYRLNILNATNQKNWAPPNSVYGNASILAMPGTEAHFTVKYSF